MKEYIPKPLSIIPITKSVEDELEYIEHRKLGKIRSLKTPWSKYNYVSMGGIEWFTIHTIGGMSGSGKTAILNQLETKLFELNPTDEFDVLSFTFEMLSRNLIGRKISSNLSVSVQTLHSGRENEKLDETTFEQAKAYSEHLKTLPIYYVENAGTVDQIMDTIFAFAKQQQMKTGGKYKRSLLITLDHTTLVHGKSGELERTILVELLTRINNAKKWFYANHHQIAFVLLTQMNREIESSDRITEPTLHFPQKRDIFGGDACYQFSDVVMIAMNPFERGITAYGVKGWPTQGYIYFHFLKVREGQPLIAQMLNQLQFNRIVDATNSEKSVALTL